MLHISWHFSYILGKMIIKDVFQMSDLMQYVIEDFLFNTLFDVASLCQKMWKESLRSMEEAILDTE